MVVNAQAGVEVSTERLWERCEEAGVARAVIVNMLDRERTDFQVAGRPAGDEPGMRCGGDPHRSGG